jgi:hypothetical protein
MVVNGKYLAVLLGISLPLAACSDGAQRSNSTEFLDSLGIVFAINPPFGAWAADEVWRVEADLTLGELDRSPEEAFGAILGIAITTSGEIAVLDRQANEVRLFDSSGSFVRSIGRRGEGPGEFSIASLDLLVGSGDTLYVPDLRNARVNRFLHTGEALNTLPFPRRAPGGQIFGWSLMGSDRLFYREWNPAQGTSALITIARSVPDEPDTLLVLDHPRPPERPEPSIEQIVAGTAKLQIDPFIPLPIWTVLESGSIVTGHTERHELRIHSADGRLERVIVGPTSRSPLGDEDRPILQQKFAEQTSAAGTDPTISAMFELMMPDSLPGYTAVLEGPDRTLLAQRAAPLNEMNPAALGALQVDIIGGATWDVFDGDGRYLGVLDTGDPIRHAKVIDDFLYGVTTSDLGEQHIVRLRIVQPD